MNFCCVFYGTKYKVEYVQNLYNMVQRNLTIPHNFVCFTDDIRLHRKVTGDIWKKVTCNTILIVVYESYYII